MKAGREAKWTLEEKHACSKCSHKFVFFGHAKKCACQECSICKNKEEVHWFRDLEKHNCEKHGATYVNNKRAHLFGPLRKSCVRGYVDFQKQLEATGNSKALALHKKTRNFARKREDSDNVKIAAKILGKDLDDPAVEGIGTWCAEEFETMGQDRKSVV